jgi:hypothetical protein
MGANSTSAKGTFGPETIKGTGIALIVLTSLVVVARFAGTIRRFKDIKPEDYLLLVAYLFFLELTILYIYIAPAIFRLASLEAGLIQPYPTVLEDSKQLQIVFFVTTSSLWLCLWMVKFSLLSMYKRLLVGKTYIIVWWIITVSCALVCNLQSRISLLGSLLITSLGSSSLAASSHPGFPARASTHGSQQEPVVCPEINVPRESVSTMRMR